MKPRFRSAALVLVLACVLRAAEGPAPAPADPKGAFARLKSLAGEWQGSVGKPDGPATTVIYRVTANGNTVMETLFPGSDHEMISMYHLDGPELVLTHYCAAGNQPRMKFSPEKSSATNLVFDFTGGTNLDPAKDGHIHNGRIRLSGEDRLQADWVFHADGKAAGTNSLFLGRRAK